MIRIKCKTPSTGCIKNFTVPSLGTAWTVVAEAPDFSVPDTRKLYVARDQTDDSRAIRPGEIFFMTPFFARNKSQSACWVEVKLVLENGTTVDCPGRMTIPAGDTALIPVQGRSLLKRDHTSSAGDTIQMRAETAGSLDLWGTGEEKPSSEHTYEV